MFLVPIILILFGCLMLYQLLNDSSTNEIVAIAFFTIWSLLILFMILITPKRIVMSDNQLNITWIGRRETFKRGSVSKISKFKYPAMIYFLRIIQEEPFPNRNLSKKLPILVNWELEPYYKLEPNRVYNIVDEMEKWIRDKEFNPNDPINRTGL